MGLIRTARFRVPISESARAAVERPDALRRPHWQQVATVVAASSPSSCDTALFCTNETMTYLRTRSWRTSFATVVGSD